MSQITITNDELEAMLDRAAHKGAKEALRSIGLLDDSAQKDITEMRSLLEAWRDTRKSIWTTVIRITTTAVLVFIAGAVWMNVSK